MPKEAFEKYERIIQMSNWGFNTPRMYYIPRGSFNEISRSAVEKFVKDAPHANLRTYDIIQDKREGYNRPHHVLLPINQDFYQMIKELNEKYICMIDLEDPRLGIYSGNIVLLDYASNEKHKIFIDYIHKPDGGAMVRFADTHISVKIRESYSELVPEPLWKIVEIAKRCPLSNQVLEWSIHREPSGMKQENIIWWEYRNFR